jgi:hypothetical protein
MTSSFQQPFQTVNDLDGVPLTNGFIYFGLPNTDPTVLANRISIFYDAACTIAAPNPVRTSGGFLLNVASPANIYVAGTADFSVAVHNSNNTPRYTIASYPVRLLAGSITFDTLTMGTSIIPDAAGGAFNGSTTLPWSSTVSRAMQAKTIRAYDQTQPTAAADLAIINQLCMPLAAGKQTSVAAFPTVGSQNIKNISAFTHTALGVYAAEFIVAIPDTAAIVCTCTISGIIASASVNPGGLAAAINIRRHDDVAVDVPFSIVVFGNPAVADPIL